MVFTSFVGIVFFGFDFHYYDEESGRFRTSVAREISAQAEALVAKAHTICPYSKATRGNIEVKLHANGDALQQAG